jgi:hypothetical protein
MQLDCKEIVILNSHFGCLYPKKSLAQRRANPDILSKFYQTHKCLDLVYSQAQRGLDLTSNQTHRSLGFAHNRAQKKIEFDILPNL